MNMNEINDIGIRDAFCLVKEENIITRKRLDSLEEAYLNLIIDLEDLKNHTTKKPKVKPKSKKKVVKKKSR